MNDQLLKLLYRTSEVHALAKMRMHTDETTERLKKVTSEFGKLIRRFRDDVSVKYATVETPAEVAKRNRNQARQQDGGAFTDMVRSGGPRPKTLNLNTYKFHSLGDYPMFIHLFGGSDSYSTQLVCPK